MRDVIIIGAGAAAMSSGMYALGKQLNYLMIYETLGGKAGSRQSLVGQVETEYLAGEEAVRLFERRLAAQEGHMLRDRVTKVARTAGHFVVETARHGTHEAVAVIVATGAMPVKLDVPGAAELAGQGLGYSVTTHAHLLVGKTAAVIGMTVRAMRGVAELSRTAEQVYMIVPGVGAPMVHALANRPNVQVFEQYRVKEIAGPMNVEEVVLEQNGQETRLAVDAAFVDMGLKPNSELVRGLAQLDDEGFIWVDTQGATSVPGLFAAGDVTTSFGEQVLIAVGEGARAALSAYDYILMHAPLGSVA